MTDRPRARAHSSVPPTCAPGRGGLCGQIKRIVGWAMADHLRAELVVDALEMAVARRRLARERSSGVSAR